MSWLETILFGAVALSALMWAGLTIYILGVQRRRETTRATLASTLAALERVSNAEPADRLNAVRPLLHELATRDDNQAVRRLAIMALRNGSPQRDTIGILAALGNDDEQDRELREAAAKVAQTLRKKAGPAK